MNQIVDDVTLVKNNIHSMGLSSSGSVDHNLFPAFPQLQRLTSLILDPFLLNCLATSAVDSVGMKVLDKTISQTPLAFPDLPQDDVCKSEYGSDRNSRVLIILVGAVCDLNSTPISLRNGMISFHDIGMRPTREYNVDYKQMDAFDSLNFTLW